MPLPGPCISRVLLTAIGVSGIWPAVAASDSVILERSAMRAGAWLALELQDQQTSRVFCAAETELRKSGVFRINYYSPAESFVEIFPLPHGDTGAASIVFDSDDYDLRVDGTRYADAWVIDLTDRKMTGAVMLVLSEARELTITDGTTSLDVPVAGSRVALERFVDCTKSLHLKNRP